MRVRVMRRTQTHGRRSWPCPCLIVIQIHPFLRVLVLSYPCLVPLEHPGVISQLSESEGSASGGKRSPTYGGEEERAHLFGKLGRLCVRFSFKVRRDDVGRRIQRFSVVGSFEGRPHRVEVYNLRGGTWNRCERNKSSNANLLGRGC